MSKIMVFNEEARQSIARGVAKLSNAVKITMGPKGKNVVLEKEYGSPIIINDGVTIARAVSLKDPYENIGAQLVKDVASKTNDVAGDGTTTATVLTDSILSEGLRHVTAGASPIHIKRGIDKAVAALKDELKAMSRKISGRTAIAQVASISANNDTEIGNIIADGMSRVGEHGVITVEESKTSETFVDVTEGLQFDQGYMSHYFVNKVETAECVYEDVRVLICAKKIDKIQDLMEILNYINSSNKSLLIIAEDITPEVLATLALNKIKVGLRVVAVKAPGFGDWRTEQLNDLCAITGATLVSDVAGIELDKVDESHLGEAKKVIVEKGYTTIVDGRGDKEAIQERIKVIKHQITEADQFNVGKLKERLSKITGGIAVLNVGAASEVEMKEKKARIEDALNAARVAVEEGIVPGGGVALLRARKVLKDLKLEGDQAIGVNIIYKAVEAPLWQIATNAGQKGDVAVEATERDEGDVGYNAAKDCYENLIEAGVIDPTKVTRTALENAASVAGMMLTTDCVVAIDPENKKKGHEEELAY
jgi:chaperonin GroEL